MKSRFCRQSLKMAAFAMASALRACSKCGHIMSTLVALNTRNISPKIQAAVYTRLLSTSQQLLTQSSSTEKNSESQNEYPADFEVSYDEFKYVEQILPRLTVPDIPHHESFPTPSGWFPPNDALRSQHKFLVRRTKNHMLPVYSSTQLVYYGIKHLVTIRKIEGDIWALESELRDYLLKKTGLKVIRTQVHEVSRQIRIRGLHAPLVAEFLLACGM